MLAGQGRAGACGMLDTTQTSERGVRWWLSGAARAPRTPKAQTHLFSSVLAPLPSNNTQKFHWAGSKPDRLPRGHPSG